MDVASNRIALSFDVEDWYHSRHVTSLDCQPNNNVLGFKEKYNKEYNLLEKPLNYLLNLLHSYNIKATFFIVGDLIEENASIIKEIASQGHEIACHGLHHIEYLGPGSSAEQSLFKENILSAKRLLEELTGQEVIGFRAPSAYYQPWMTDILLALGFHYDSSIAYNSLYKKIPMELINKERNPYFLESQDSIKERLVEIPWPYLNILGFKLPAGGGPVMRYFGGSLMAAGLSQSLQKGDTVFYCHPLDVSSEPLPEIVAKSRKRFWLGRGVRAQKSLEKVLSSFNPAVFTSCRDVYTRFLNSTQKGQLYDN